MASLVIIYITKQKVTINTKKISDTLTNWMRFYFELEVTTSVE